MVSLTDNSVVQELGVALTGVTPESAVPTGGNQPSALECGESLIDAREALFNERAQGPANRIQLPTQRITRLHGLMIDLDPSNLEPDNRLFRPSLDPREFYRNIEDVLDRHPLIQAAEVRNSGTGLHLLLWLDPPVELKSAGEQRYWDGIIRAVQATLPSDPNAPGITALTRPVGSINSKNGARVETLRPGSAIDSRRVVDFVSELKAAPFRVIARILLGDDEVSPCPICMTEPSRLGALEHVGRCYRCGTVTLDRLYDAVLLRGAPVEAEDDTSRPKPKKQRTPDEKVAGSRTRRGSRDSR